MGFEPQKNKMKKEDEKNFFPTCAWACAPAWGLQSNSLCFASFSGGFAFGMGIHKGAPPDDKKTMK